MARTNPVIIQKVENPWGAVIFFGKAPKDYLQTLGSGNVGVRGGICEYNIYKSWGQIIKDDIIASNLTGNIIIVYEKPVNDSESLRKRFNAHCYTYGEFAAKISYDRLAYEALQYIGSNVYFGEEFSISHSSFVEPIMGASETDTFSIDTPVGKVSELNIYCSLEKGVYKYSVPMVKDSRPVDNSTVVQLMGEGFDRVSAVQ